MRSRGLRPPRTWPAVPEGQSATDALADRVRVLELAVAALDMCLFPRDPHNGPAREDLVRDLAALMESRGWAGPAAENEAYIAEAVERAVRLGKADGGLRTCLERAKVFYSQRLVGSNPRASAVSACTWIAGEIAAMLGEAITEQR